MVTMQKEKNISVRYYLNYKLKPKTIDGIDHYPIYVQVNCNGKNGQFKLELFNKPVFVSEELKLEDKNFTDFKKQIDRKTKMIEEIVNYESSIVNGYKPTNIGKRLEYYKKDILEVSTSISLEFLSNFSSDKMIYKNYMEMNSMENLHERFLYFVEYFIPDKKNYKTVFSQVKSKLAIVGLSLLIEYLLKENFTKKLSCYDLLVLKEERYFKEKFIAPILGQIETREYLSIPVIKKIFGNIDVDKFDEIIKSIAPDIYVDALKEIQSYIFSRR